MNGHWIPINFFISLNIDSLKFACFIPASLSKLIPQSPQTICIQQKPSQRFIKFEKSSSASQTHLSLLKEMEAVECYICYEEVHPPQKIWIEPACGKIWHYECMREWYRTSTPRTAIEGIPDNFPPTCPNCRAVIPGIRVYAKSLDLEAAGGYNAHWMFMRTLKSGFVGFEDWWPLSAESVDNEVGVGSDDGIDLVYSAIHGSPDQAAWLLRHVVPSLDFFHRSVTFAPVAWTPSLLPKKGRFDLPELDNIPVPPEVEEVVQWPFNLRPDFREAEEVYHETFGVEPVVGMRFLYRITPQLIADAVASESVFALELHQQSVGVPEGQVMWVQVIRVPTLTVQWTTYRMVPQGETPTFDDGRQTPNMGL